MKKFHQGSLDGLCGIYCIVNAANLMVPNLDYAKLFSKLIKNIGNKLSRIIIDGITLEELEKHVFSTTRTYLLKNHKIEFSYKAIDCKSLNKYWKIIKRHSEQNGSGSIILGMNGVREHWTCISKVYEKTIDFADSGILNRLYRSHITIKTPTRKRKHYFIPNETFLLEIKSIPSLNL
jgi:hypothetical protein